MKSSAARSTALFSNAPSQSTAPVLEFRCLYSHDLRRKQKRWQDGYCKFHAFNKRVMVYDVSRNFIGDTHWQDSDCLQEGDETTLDRCGVLLQVGDQIGSSETDLTALFERNREKAKTSDTRRELSFAARQTLGGKTGPTSRPPVGLLKHRSLNALLGTPKGAIGRAVVPKSSYEQQHGSDENIIADTRSPKRQKRNHGPDDGPHAHRDAAEYSSDMPSWKQRPSRPPTTVPDSRKSSKVRQVIDITSDHESESGPPPASDITIPSTPIRSARATPPLAAKRSFCGSSGKKTTVNVPLQKSAPADFGRKDVMADSERAQGARIDGQRSDNLEQHADLSKPKRKAKPLRLAKNEPRTMLVCQNLPTKTRVRETTSKRQPSDVRLGSEDKDGLSSFEQGGRVVGKNKQPNSQNQTIEATLNALAQETDSTVESSHPQTPQSPPAFSTMPPRKVLRKYHAREQQTPGRIEADPRGVFPETAAIREAPPSHADHTPSLQDSQQAHDLTRSFRRTHSANDASGSLSLSFPPDAFSTLPLLDEAEPVANARPAAAAPPARRKSPTKRSFSANDCALGEEQQPPFDLRGEREAPNQKDADLGPWSTEALDLFDWRPPDWEDRVRRRAAAVEAAG